MSNEGVDRNLYFGKPPEFYKQNRQYKFCSNFISTSRYNIITFLPVSLLTQFTRVANFYFLIIAILSCFPVISPYSPLSAIAPLAFVVALSMVRDGYEDYQRHKSDNELNSSTASVRTLKGSNGFTTKTWKDVKVGDICLIEDHEIISADMVVLCSSLDSGVVFIETSSLDGEKNLKPKQAVTEFQQLIFDKQSGKPNIPDTLAGKISCMQPNAQFYQFDGVLYFENQKYPLNHKHLILRGSRLKNIHWALGVVVYTGIDTKIMRNADEGRHKMSNIDIRTNYLILYVLLIQIFLCALCAVIYRILCYQASPVFVFFNNQNYTCTENSLIVFAVYFLLLNTFIPISLIVSLEFIKVAQGYFMEKDLELFTEHNQRAIKVFTTSINEELGQVQYIFTDKTGTLTCNRMEFKLCVCGETTYGDMSIFSPEEKTSFVENQIIRQQTNNRLARKSIWTDTKGGVEYNFEGKQMDKAMNDPKESNIELNLKFYSSGEDECLYTIQNQGELIKENLFLLATTHECVLETDEKTQELRYQGPSPDEIALVDAARRMGFFYKGTSMNSLILDIQGNEKRVDLLRSFEFNSDRKRMSVIIRDEGKIKMYVKGADSIIKARLYRQQPFLNKINELLEFFSKKGLRTLCLGMKVLTEEEYQKFDQDLNNCLGQENCEQKQQAIISDMEQNFMLLGATAVEDKLQEDVPETLADFIKANINVWMLTGDKLETAENIGRSCNLVQQDMKVFYITPELNAESVFIELNNHINTKSRDKRALIVEGTALTDIQKNQQLEQSLVDVAPFLHSVICCRVTPKQKADMVRLVKNKLKKITVAVGDGANDVNMIMEAHIGIGIYGEEGMRAVQSSNYAIGQFKCLWKLILYHGRMNYIRVSEMILYFFYKNIIFTVPQLFFGFYNQFSGQTVFNDYYISLYNTVFTFLPVVIRAIFDEDIYYTSQKKSTIYGSRRLSIVGTAETRSQIDIVKQHYPKLYYIGQKNRIFTDSRFFKWFSIGVLQGAVCYYVFFFELDGSLIFSEGGYTIDIWFFSISVFTAIMLLVTLKLAINTQFWTILTWFAYLGSSLGTYFAYVFISSDLPGATVYRTAKAVFTSPVFWLTLVLSVLAMFVFDLSLFTIKTSKDTLLNYFKKQARSNSNFDMDNIHRLNLKLDEELAKENELINMKNQKKNKSRPDSLNSTISVDSNRSEGDKTLVNNGQTNTETEEEQKSDQDIQLKIKNQQSEAIRIEL